jgi:hypothetical protein
LRYDSPLQLTKRRATREMSIGGQQIRPGDQILLCLAAANRDPAVFARPDDFDVTRDGLDHFFMPSDDGRLSTYADPARRVDGTFLTDLATWLSDTARPGHPANTGLSPQSGSSAC